MRSRWNLPIYTTYLALCLLVIGYIVAQVGIPAPWSHQYSVTANFADAGDILVNNEVYMDGVRVGRIGAVSVQDGLAHVTLVITDSRALPLHSNASAEVRKKNLLGETYIDLQAGSAPGQLADGGVIPVDHTVPITAIDQVLAIFDPETVQRLQLLINSLGDATNNNGQNMNNEASSFNQLLTSLNGPALVLSTRRQQLNDIVLELQRFYAVLANQRQQVRDEFGTWNQVMAQMANQETSIGGTLQQADQLLTSADTLVSGEGANLGTLLAKLPTSLASANAFLAQSNTITADLAPYRQYINDIFPALKSSFSGVDAGGQHLLSAYDTNCNIKTCIGDIPSAYSPNASGDVWAALTAGGSAP